jgi:hypothetical protein
MKYISHPRNDDKYAVFHMWMEEKRQLYIDKDAVRYIRSVLANVETVAI